MPCQSLPSGIFDGDGDRNKSLRLVRSIWYKWMELHPIDHRNFQRTKFDDIKWSRPEIQMWEESKVQVPWWFQKPSQEGFVLVECEDCKIATCTKTQDPIKVPMTQCQDDRQAWTVERSTTLESLQSYEQHDEPWYQTLPIHQTIQFLWRSHATISN